MICASTRSPGASSTRVGCATSAAGGISARDILYLWVARMVFMSLHFLNVVPFSDVLIHGTVLAPDGRRMSKSLGTGVDPLDMIERYGADATRAWTAYFGTSGQDIRFSEEKINSYQRFANT